MQESTSATASGLGAGRLAIEWENKIKLSKAMHTAQACELDNKACEILLQYMRMRDPTTCGSENG